MKKSRRYKENLEKIKKEGDRPRTLEEAITELKSLRQAKFDETVELATRLGVDPRHADQMVRGTVVLPNGIGKKVRVLVLTKGPKQKEAEEAGADWVGAEEYINKIQEGWLDFDAVIATPDMMSQVGKLGKILGPRGLMPNPKSGTVTQDVARAVKEIKAGKIEYRVDKGGNVHAPIGKLSFTDEQLVENAQVLLEAIIKARPQAAKGQYIKGISLSTTMSPGIKVDRQSLVRSLKL